MLYIIILILCLTMPEITILSVKETINLWFSSVVPVLLPFFIISKAIYYNGGIVYFTKILSPLLKILGLPQNLSYPFAMTLMCGYQTGSKTVAQLEKDGLKNIDYFANICFSSSPLFVIGTVGTAILNNTKTGYTLYLIHILTVLIFASLLKQDDEENVIFNTTTGSLTSAITESITAIFSVCCYMILFSLIINVISLLNFIPIEIKTFLIGILEFTKGIKNASDTFEYPLPIISFFLSFGGICVITQCINNYKNIKIKKFILCRTICGIIAFLLCFVYKKTAIHVPILITVVIIILSNIIRRKKNYLLKSSKSSVT